MGGGNGVRPVSGESLRKHLSEKATRPECGHWECCRNAVTASGGAGAGIRLTGNEAPARVARRNVKELEEFTDRRIG